MGGSKMRIRSTRNGSHTSLNNDPEALVKNHPKLKQLSNHMTFSNGIRNKSKSISVSNQHYQTHNQIGKESSNKSKTIQTIPSESNE
jgi:hypothetical protein